MQGKYCANSTVKFLLLDQFLPLGHLQYCEGGITPLTDIVYIILKTKLTVYNKKAFKYN